jgi:hypothetical protein
LNSFPTLHSPHAFSRCTLHAFGGANRQTRLLSPHSPFHKFTLSPPQSRPEPARRGPEECRTPSCKLVDAFRPLLLVSLSLLPRTRPPPPPWEVPRGGRRASPIPPGCSCRHPQGTTRASRPTSASSPQGRTSRGRPPPRQWRVRAAALDRTPGTAPSRCSGPTDSLSLEDNVDEGRRVVPSYHTYVLVQLAGPSRRWCSSTSAATARRTVCLVSLNCTFLKKKQILAAICEKVVVISRKLR